MLTGDNRVTADAIARRLGIDDIEADVLPDQKSAVVARLKSEGYASLEVLSLDCGIDGAPEQLTTGVARDIYGADASFNEAATSTAIPTDTAADRAYADAMQSLLAD